MLKKYVLLKSIFLACFLCAVFFLSIQPALAATPETAFPTDIPNATTPNAESKLPDYILYGFWFIIALAGIVAVMSIAWGAFKILVFPTDPSVRSDAWDRIWNAALGLALLFLTVIILTTINPDLARLRLGNLEPINSCGPTNVLNSGAGSIINLGIAIGGCANPEAAPPIQAPPGNGSGNQPVVVFPGGGVGGGGACTSLRWAPCTATGAIGRIIPASESCCLPLRCQAPLGDWNPARDVIRFGVCM